MMNIDSRKWRVREEPGLRLWSVTSRTTGEMRFIEPFASASSLARMSECAFDRACREAFEKGC